MKKVRLIIIGIVVLSLAYAGWNIFGSTVSAPAKKYFYIKTNSSYEDIRTSLVDQKIVKSSFFFNIIAKQLKYPEKIKAGRYEIKEGSSLLSLVRMLKSGTQTPVRFVITKLRTKEDLASRIGMNFEADSTEAIRFLMSNDSLSKYDLDTNTVISTIIPNSYMFYWNGAFGRVFTRLKDQHDKFWEGKRTEKAKALGLSPTEVYTLASIVEEETNKQDDKGKIASVYLNRLHKGMNLGADPTIKYAMRNFGLKRIYNVYLQYESPYNTYLHGGLPPGPICTPSINTIDAVLDAPPTDYIFFVAKPDFNGYSNFATNYEDHKKFARAYQVALDSLVKRKQQNNSAGQ